MIFTKSKINIISFVISFLLIILLRNLFFQIEKKETKIKVTFIENSIQVNSETKEENKEKIKENNIIEKNNEKKWKIEIPAISLIAEISEGTNQNVMNEYVGHFENTSKTNGNIRTCST